MPDVVQLDEMSRISIDKVNKDSLVDIETIQIDSALPIAERMIQYLERIKNPYCFLCGGTPVRVRFTDTGKTLDEAIKSHFCGLKVL